MARETSTGVVCVSASCCPAVFSVGFDRRFVFREGEFKPDVGIEMAVRNVVNDLANRPAFGSIGRVELLVGEAFHGGAEVGWSLFDVV